MKIFDIDGPLYKLMTALMNLLMLSLCVLLFSVPIVTVGASLVAGCDVALRMVDNEEGYITKQFFKAFKSNFKQGFLLELISLVGAYAIYLDFELYRASKSGPIFLLIIGMLTVFLYVLSMIYAYPQVARYENTVPNIVRNSFRISMKFFPRTIGLVFLLVIEIAAFMWDTTTMFMGVLIGPGCLLYTVSFVAKGIFKIIEKDTKSEVAEETDYPERETELQSEQYIFPNAMTPEDMVDAETEKQDDSDTENKL